MSTKSANISITLHGIFDYLTGILLVTSPRYLPFPDNPMKIIAFALGGSVLVYSLMTDYPAAILRFLPFPVHRTLDFFVGFGLCFSPIHFATYGAPAVLFVILGLLLMVMAFLTRGRFSPTGQDQPVIPGA